jgi:hypothetical protein
LQKTGLAERPLPSKTDLQESEPDDLHPALDAYRERYRRAVLLAGDSG